MILFVIFFSLTIILFFLSPISVIILFCVFLLLIGFQKTSWKIYDLAKLYNQYFLIFSITYILYAGLCVFPFLMIRFMGGIEDFYIIRSIVTVIFFVMCLCLIIILKNKRNINDNLLWWFPLFSFPTIHCRTICSSIQHGSYEFQELLPWGENIFHVFMDCRYENCGGHEMTYLSNTFCEDLQTDFWYQIQFLSIFLPFVIFMVVQFVEKKINISKNIDKI